MNLTSRPAVRSRSYGPALLCTAVFLLCELIARPFAAIGVCDDWSYLVSAETLEHTGRIVYNGGATAMLGVHLYLGALFLRLFGDSYTSVRLSTILIAVCTVFLMQRVFVRCGVREGNAVFAALTVALSPIFMEISATYMTDMTGVFAIVLCMYGCVRSLQAGSERSALAWVIFAVAANTVMGTARQIAWLGVLVMVPGTLWLLRKHKSVLLGGVPATLMGWAAVYACMHWFAKQPWVVPEHIFGPVHGLHMLAYMGRQWSRPILQSPLLILPLLLSFLVTLRQQSRKFWITFAILGALYAAMAYTEVRLQAHGSLLQPLMADWFDPLGFYDGSSLYGAKHVALGTATRIVLTVLWFLGSLTVVWIVARVRSHSWPLPQAQVSETVPADTATAMAWRPLAVLTVPLLVAYFGLLLPRSTGNLFDRYLLPVDFFLALLLVRLLQEFVRPSPPRFAFAVLAVVALFSIASTHDLFSFSRARVAMASELRAAGIPATSVEGGFEFDSETELQASGHINQETIVNPPHSYVHADPKRGMTCPGTDRKDEVNDTTPHLVPRYAVSFDATACAGAASPAAVPYSRWQLLRTDYLYLVNLKPRQ